MKVFEQLELQLWQTLQTAHAQPETAKVGVLWVRMEEAIQGHEIKAQVEISAEAILQMARVVERRLQVLDEAVAMRSGADPVMPEDAFDQFVRQYMDVDFDQFVEAIGRKEHEYPESRELASVVAEVSKEELLESLEDESAVEDLMERLEHGESVEEWANEIVLWMKERGLDQVGFAELLDGIGFEAVKTWLAVLLGGFEMRQAGGFYDGNTIVVELEK